ncbi:MAG: hypothetical protein ACR2OI_00760, partial [Acidimicrobiia bacterium]
LIPAGTGADEYQVVQPSLPNATVMTPGDLFGDSIPEGAAEEELPANPAEWLASLGAQTDGDEG